MHNKLKTILSEKFGIAESLITSSSRLREDLNLSELEQIDLITQITQDLKFELPVGFDMKSIQTVEDVDILIDQQNSDL